MRMMTSADTLCSVVYEAVAAVYVVDEAMDEIESALGDPEQYDVNSGW